MKSFKISLVIIFGLIVAFFTIKSIIRTTKPGDPQELEQNPFVKSINDEIDSLNAVTVSQFCKNRHEEISYHINEHYRNKKLGKIALENDQQKENLSKKLYAIYVAKFLQQAFYVFQGTEWKVEDLAFIRTEYQSLQSSLFLERGSPVEMKFHEIRNILDKYNEITSFIYQVRKFSYSETGLNDRFPINVVENYLAKVKAYINSNLENRYVKNCKRLKDGLSDLPNYLFTEHVSYLDKKINQWTDWYPNCTSQKDYLNTLYNPIKAEMDVLFDIPYNVNNIQEKYDRLYSKWSQDSKKAYNYTYKK